MYMLVHTILVTEAIKDILRHVQSEIQGKQNFTMWGSNLPQPRIQEFQDEHLTIQVTSDAQIVLSMSQLIITANRWSRGTV